MKCWVLIFGILLLAGCSTLRVADSTQEEGSVSESPEDDLSDDLSEDSSTDVPTSDEGGNADPSPEPASEVPVSEVSSEVPVEEASSPVEAAAVMAGSPFLNATFYVDPNSDAAEQIIAWQETMPEDAVLLEAIASQSSANWFGDWNSDIAASVNRKVTTITNAGALPVLVAYNIPNRDCGGYSAGGSADSAAYLDWIEAFAGAIGERAAVIVLEPDALGLVSCLSEADTAIRYSLLQQAVEIFKAYAQTYVYIDAGHSNWVEAAEMASSLTQAGIAEADGFALNVSNFYTNDENIAYGEELSALVGDKHFIIDTSRNGLGSNGEWCNPDGRALGTNPTTETGNDLVDAFLWIKPPGESDGTCNGGPDDGGWWAEYALGLVENAL